MDKNEMEFKHFKKTFFTAFLLIFLNGCGGGGAEKTSSVSEDKQPHTLSSNELSKVNVLASKLSLQTGILVGSDSITLLFNNTPDETTNPYHFQIFLNVDNDSSTGFQFDNYAWNDTGIDYLVENGSLYKSTSNQWSWDYVDVDTNDTSTSNTSKSITFKKSWLEGLSNKLHVGVVIRDENWDATEFHPVSTRMIDFDIFDVPPPTDTEAPVLTLNGAKVLEIQKSSRWFPGPTAIDNVDGDISHKVITTGTVDSQVVGMYELVYSVSDKAGNTSSITRIINVVDNISKSVVVDGLVGEWTHTQKLASSINGGMAVSNDGMNLNFFIKAYNVDDNTQIFIDTDNDSSTGIQFWGSEWTVGGADYMVENGILNRSTNSDTWSWDSNIGSIDYIQNGDIIEFSIPLSLLTNLGDTVNIGFISRDENWNIKYLLPTDGLASYTLSSHDVTLPNDIKLHLCDDQAVNRHLPTSTFGSLGNGVTYQGNTYSVTNYINPNNYPTNTYVLWKNAINLGEYSTKPYISSTNGALFVSRKNSWINVAGNIKSRIEGDSTVDIARSTKYTSITSLSYLNGFDVYTMEGGYGISEAKLVVRNSDGTYKDVIRRTSIGTASSTFTPNFHTFYRDSKLFYSFNLEANTGVEDRVIGVVQNATGDLKILATCN